MLFAKENLTIIIKQEQTDMTPAECRAARALVGWSQQELAEMAGVSLSTVRNVEAGRHGRSLGTFISLSHALQSAGVELMSQTSRGAVQGVKFKQMKVGDRVAFRPNSPLGRVFRRIGEVGLVTVADSRDAAYRISVQFTGETVDGADPAEFIHVGGGSDAPSL